MKLCWIKYWKILLWIVVQKPRYTLQIKGPIRIKYKCLVPNYVFPEMNCAASLFLKQNYNVLSPISFTHIYVRDFILYFQDQVTYFAAAKYVARSWEYRDRLQTYECRNLTEAVQFLSGNTKIGFSLIFEDTITWLYVKRYQGNFLWLKHLIVSSLWIRLNAIKV